VIASFSLRMLLLVKKGFNSFFGHLSLDSYDCVLKSLRQGSHKA
jgi:hypothetical protein